MSPRPGRALFLVGLAGSLIACSTPSGGSPTSLSVIVHDDRLLVSWTDGSGGHIEVWSIGENGSR